MDSAPARCPLCGRKIPKLDDLRVHLMTRHRKSELTDELLALVREEESATL